MEPRVATGWSVPLDDLGINGTVSRLDEVHNWQVRQVSSFDRSGGNNDDRFGEQVWDGGVVLADLEGPRSCHSNLDAESAWYAVYFC
jgi:hypothetical protein